MTIEELQKQQKENTKQQEKLSRMAGEINNKIKELVVKKFIEMKYIKYFTWELRGTTLSPRLVATGRAPTLLSSYADLRKEVHCLLAPISSSWGYHFGFTIAPGIEFRSDDGEFSIRLDTLSTNSKGNLLQFVEENKLEVLLGSDLKRSYEQAKNLVEMVDAFKGKENV